MPKNIRPEHIKEFEKTVEKLNSLLSKIREYEPGANYYLASDTMNLMAGPSHSSRHCKDLEPLYENSVAEVWMPSSGGGDW